MSTAPVKIRATKFAMNIMAVTQPKIGVVMYRVITMISFILFFNGYLT